MDINSINNDNTPFTIAFGDVGIAVIERGRSPLLPVITSISLLNTFLIVVAYFFKTKKQDLKIL